jgi:transcriptional regulator with XRE-family HTH domain
MQLFGSKFRAVRVKRGWRQQDVAERAGVHRTVISNIERGRTGAVSIGTILNVARALDIQVSLTARWHAGDLDRLVNGRHARLHESVARWFAKSLPVWVLEPEVSFSIYGERGVIDILAWHPGRRALLVIELKTDIVDVNQLMGSMNTRRRLARDIARDRGWDPATISVWVIVANGRTNRARHAAHRTVLRNAFPLDGRSMAGWLREPVGQSRPCRSGRGPMTDLRGWTWPRATAFDASPRPEIAQTAGLRFDRPRRPRPRRAGPSTMRNVTEDDLVVDRAASIGRPRVRSRRNAYQHDILHGRRADQVGF